MPKKKFEGDGLGTKTNTKPHCFKIGDPYDRILNELPNKSEWLRQAVISKMTEEGRID